MQDDGNLVLYGPRGALWNSGSNVFSPYSVNGCVGLAGVHCVP